MPASLALEDELGDALAVIFVEAQGASLPQAELFALKRGWLGRGGMWTTEYPVRPAGRSLPTCVLLGNDGRALLAGSPLSMEPRIEQAVKEQIALQSEPPEGTPKELAKAWSDFAAGQVGAAIAGARAVAAAKPELADAARSAEQTFLRRARARLESASRMIDTKSFAKAADALDALAKSLDGRDELATELAVQRARLDADGMRAEIEADRALTEALASLKSKPASPAEAFAALAEKYPGTQAGERARRYATALAD